MEDRSLRILGPATRTSILCGKSMEQLLQSDASGNNETREHIPMVPWKRGAKAYETVVVVHTVTGCQEEEFWVQKKTLQK